ncbi:aspartate/glutamate racemase family protein [Streptomyces sp. NPDC085481]|uniref:aspartate/glutamate racemase family protein n=1 Tax=Streptomyces sp. NPDC085481 TaxID=3365727 RepID=UPI0037D07132
MVLINPNTSAATTRMMTTVARRALAGSGIRVRGVTVTTGPVMLTDPASLRAAAPQVVAAAHEALTAGDCAALLVAAFGDPGVTELRSAALGVPVLGIGEAALAEAASGDRRFGIATTTPRLAAAIAAHVERLGLTSRYTGARFTPGAPEHLAAHPEKQLAALEAAVHACAVRDGAEAVVIGGGPLGETAEVLRARGLTLPVIAPIPTACRRIAGLLGTGPPDPAPRVTGLPGAPP